MKTDLSSSPSAQVRCGSVAGLWRYPVKSMMGEELNATEVTNYGSAANFVIVVTQGAR
jgi:uncharacterized protein YcbX